MADYAEQILGWDDYLINDQFEKMQAEWGHKRKANWFALWKKWCSYYNGPIFKPVDSGKLEDYFRAVEVPTQPAQPTITPKPQRDPVKELDRTIFALRKAEENRDAAHRQRDQGFDVDVTHWQQECDKLTALIALLEGEVAAQEFERQA